MLLYIGCHAASPPSWVCFLSCSPSPSPSPSLLCPPLGAGCLLRWTVTPFGTNCTRPGRHAWQWAASSSWQPAWPPGSWRWGPGHAVGGRQGGQGAEGRPCLPAPLCWATGREWRGWPPRCGRPSGYLKMLVGLTRIYLPLMLSNNVVLFWVRGSTAQAEVTLCVHVADNLLWICLLKWFVLNMT